jgi:hypothetical protein
MKKLSELQADGFTGTDVNIETSLYEYGLLCHKPLGAKNIQCWIGVEIDSNSNYCKFDFFTISEKDIEEIINESWFNKKSFFSFIGITEKEWLVVAHYTSKISDLVTYYGYQNIFYPSYYPVKIENDLK